MSQKIRIKRGLKSNLPTLDVGEFALTTDTNEIFIGTTTGNTPVNNEAILNFDVETIKKESSQDLYYIDLVKWGIYGDYTHPTETTDGINNAIKWAKANGYKGVYLKEGIYCINTGYWNNQAAQTGGASPALSKFVDAQGIQGINLPSDFTFEMHKDCILKANVDSAHFQTCVALYRVDNVTIIGGQIIGDRDTHNYVGYAGYGDDDVSPAYGGHGYGLYLECVKGLKVYDTYIADWHGDGIFAYGSLDYRATQDIYMKNVVSNNNRRQGMSSGGYNMLFEDCTFSNSNGQDPESGVDLEGGRLNENIVFRRCRFVGNNTMGMINYDGNVKLYDCYFDQTFGISADAEYTEVYNTTFTDDNYRNFFAKYPNLMVGNQLYQIGERTRMPDPKRTWYGQGGYVCVKAGTTSTDLSFSNKNNYPPRGDNMQGMQDSQRGITIVCGDSEWLRENYVYTYGGTGGLGGTATYKFLPVNQRAHNTTYAIGDRVHFAGGNNISVECIAGGTSGVSEPSTTGVRLDDIIIDNQVTWKVIDNVEPVGLRQNNKAYNKGEYIWWDTRDGGVWECISDGGTTGAFIPRLEDFAIGAQIRPHFATSIMTKIAYNSSYPAWQSGAIYTTVTNINIGNTSWSAAVGSAGDKYPDVSWAWFNTTITDGTVTWKKVYHRLNGVRVENCTFKNTSLIIGAQDIVAKNNNIVNGALTLSGNHVISQGNIVDNREKDTGIATSYTANSGTIRDDILRNTVTLASTFIDYKQPKKRIYEKITSENGVLYGDATLYDCTIAINRDLNALSVYGNNQIRMVGGNFSAYVLPNVKIFGAWHSTYEFLGVTFDITLPDTTGIFFNNTSRLSEGNYYVAFRDCTFRVLPLVYDAQLFFAGYSNANIKLLHNTFINLDTNKSIKVGLPTIDTANTSVINNFFDKNYYVTNINSLMNRGGYGLVTALQSPSIPTSGDYAVGTRIINSAPSVGSPRGWVVTTAGLAFQPTLRANNTTYNVGDFVKWSSGVNIYECIQAGTTASTPPSAGAGIVTDGGVQWLYRGNTVAAFTSEGNL